MDSNLNTDPASKLLQNQSEQIYQRTRLRRYLIYTMVLPPVGLFMALRARVLHLVLPSYLAAESVFFAVSTLVTIISIKPLLETLKFDVSGIFTGFWALSLIVFTIALIILGLLIGFYYKHEVRKKGFLPPLGILILFIVLILHYLASFLMVLYLNNQILLAIGELNPTLDNLYQTQEFLQP